MQGRGYSLCKVGARTGATDRPRIGQGMEEGKSAIHSLVDSNGKVSSHRCREPFLLCGCHCDRLPRRPATSQVYALDCPSVSPQSGNSIAFPLSGPRWRRARSSYLRTDEEEARFCTGLLLRSTRRGVRDWEGLATPDRLTAVKLRGSVPEWGCFFCPIPALCTAWRPWNS